MWIGEQEVDLHVDADGETIKQVNSFVLLWRYSVCGWRK